MVTRSLAGSSFQAAPGRGSWHARWAPYPPPHLRHRPLPHGRQRESRSGLAPPPLPRLHPCRLHAPAPRRPAGLPIPGGRHRKGQFGRRSRRCRPASRATADPSVDWVNARHLGSRTHRRGPSRDPSGRRLSRAHTQRRTGSPPLSRDAAATPRTRSLSEASGSHPLHVPRREHLRISCDQARTASDPERGLHDPRCGHPQAHPLDRLRVPIAPEVGLHPVGGTEVAPSPAEISRDADSP
jgi:hypothetical protein